MAKLLQARWLTFLAIALTASISAAGRDKFVPVPASRFKPEMVVELAYPGWDWCKTLNDYAIYSKHMRAGELTKALNMRETERCGPIPADEKWLILSVKRFGPNALLELGPTDRSSATGYWTMHEGVRPAR